MVCNKIELKYINVLFCLAIPRKKLFTIVYSFCLRDYFQCCVEVRRVVVENRRESFES